MPALPELISPRLRYQPLSAENLDSFHALATDEHVRRFLLDGQVVDRSWCEDQKSASDDLFRERGLGLWLAWLNEGLLGFCGFIRFPETGPEPQLLYALTAAHAGHGLATEMARALIKHVRANQLATHLIAAVDQPNAASSRVLAKLGFVLSGSYAGAFGRVLEYRLEL